MQYDLTTAPGSSSAQAHIAASDFEGYQRVVALPQRHGGQVWAAWRGVPLLRACNGRDTQDSSVRGDFMHG